MEPPELPAYGRILLDVLSGNSALSIRADEAEEAWRVLTPVLEGWSRNLVPLEAYDDGSNASTLTQGVELSTNPRLSAGSGRLTSPVARRQAQ